MIEWLDHHLIETLTTCLLAVIATLLAAIRWSLGRWVRTQDSHGTRIEALETDHVTRDHLDELRHSLMVTATQNQERTEHRLDRMFELLMERK